MKKKLWLVGVFVTSLIASFGLCKLAGAEETPEVLIWAVNPGYTVDGKANTGEMIELKRLTEHSISLAGLKIYYTNSSGNRSLLYEFPEKAEMTGEALLLRLASAPEAEQADANYTKTLAMAVGPLELVRDEEVLDQVCWTGKTGCLAKFVSANPTSLVRDAETKEFAHRVDYVPQFDAEHPGMTVPAESEEVVVPRCKTLQFSEVLTWFETERAEQFVEVFNAGDEQVLMDGCSLRYKGKLFPFEGVVKSREYAARFAGDFALTKNPTATNKLEIIDTDGSVVDTLLIYNGQKRGVSLAQFGHDKSGREQWRQTYQPTPGEANAWQEWQSCPEGKVLNKETGNCVKAVTLKILEPCPPGQYRNPLTGRCKKYETETEKKPCPEGWVRNEATGRCRKIVQNTGAEHAIEKEKMQEEKEFVALGAMLAIGAVGVGYVVWQFRKELKAGWQGLKRKLGRKK